MKKWNRLTLVYGIVMITLFTGITYIGIIWKKQEKIRKDFETKLVEETKNYLKEQEVFPLGLETLYINMDDIIAYSNLDTEKISDQECTGYIKVWEDEEDHYEPFLKCKNYTTKGYSEE